MFIFKIAKFFVKLFFGIVLAAVILVAVIRYCVNYTKEVYDYGKDVPHMMSLYYGAKKSPAGTYIKCPWYDCTEQFFKETDNHNFCCKQHEVYYWEAVRAYEEMKRVEETTGALYK